MKPIRNVPQPEGGRVETGPIHRKLDQATCAQAAKPFAAEPEVLTASKSILDTRATSFRSVLVPSGGN